MLFQGVHQLLAQAGQCTGCLMLLLLNALKNAKCTNNLSYVTTAEAFQKAYMLHYGVCITGHTLFHRSVSWSSTTWTGLGTPMLFFSS